MVRRIFQMYLEGMGSVKIMKLLTEEGVPAPLGGLWNASVVMEMLKNEKKWIFLIFMSRIISY